MQVLEDKPLTLLSFSTETAEELKWEHEKEFEYQGEMYDIIRSYVQGDTIYYECWKDHEESKIKRRIYNLVAQDHSRMPWQQDSKNRLLIFFQSLYHNQTKQNQSQPFRKEQQLANHHQRYYYFLDGDRPPSPPPEV